MTGSATLGFVGVFFAADIFLDPVDRSQNLWQETPSCSQVETLERFEQEDLFIFCVIRATRLHESSQSHLKDAGVMCRFPTSPADKRINNKEIKLAPT